MRSDISWDVPTFDDLESIHEIYNDPRVWKHFPSGRHLHLAQTESMLRGWIDGWARDGLSTWIVRDATSGVTLGNAGCMMRRGMFWNLGYRLAFDVHGRGIASQVARAAVRAAQTTRPEHAVVAYLLEHNVASARVAEKVGLMLQLRAPDAGNPDPEAIRLVYADRPLTEQECRAVLS